MSVANLFTWVLGSMSTHGMVDKIKELVICHKSRFIVSSDRKRIYLRPSSNLELFTQDVLLQAWMSQREEMAKHGVPEAILAKCPSYNLAWITLRATNDFGNSIRAGDTVYLFPSAKAAEIPGVLAFEMRVQGA